MDTFIIKLDGNNFFTSVKNDVFSGTPYPGLAKPFSYDEADKLAREFREKGYPGAVATDRYGAIPTAADLISVKRAVQYEVRFSGYYFVGVNAAGREQGSKDHSQAMRMSQEAAVEIARKLKRARHLDATIIEAGSTAVDVEAEVEKIWPGN